MNRSIDILVIKCPLLSINLKKAYNPLFISIMVLAHNVNEGLRTRDVRISEDVTFNTMLLAEKTLQGLTNSGFYKPSPIQLHAIPLGKCGFDLLLEAKSGTGKTGVFTVIALEKLDLSKGLQTLILAPTREIAAQICDVIKQISCAYKDLNTVVVMGGLPIQDDIEKFKKRVHIAVGSPGRLRHLIQSKHIDTSTVRLLVLDEADKLMDKSFQTDINYIFSILPQQKQVILSSATYPETLMCIMKNYVHNAQHICPETTSVLLGIKQFVTSVKNHVNVVRQTQHRFDELLNILSKNQFKQCLIFCNYQVRVKELARMLISKKWPAEQLHGQQEQTDRLEALKTLQEYKCRILISTDLAARGIDASNVDLVINFEPPYEWETYLHRIGRAGRFGSYGIAITILSEGDEKIKFSKMITTINDKLELTNFWDREKYNLDHSDTSSSATACASISKLESHSEDDIDNLDEHKYENLEVDVEIQTVESLINYFKESKDYNIESFSDLLSSFQSHPVEDKLEIESNKSVELIDDLKDLPVVESNKLLESNTICDKESNYLNVNGVYEHNKDKETALETLQQSYSKSKKRHKENKTHLNNNVISESINICDNDQMTRALLEAGLPTCFSSQPSTRKPKSNRAQHKKESIHYQDRQKMKALDNDSSSSFDNKAVQFNTQSHQFTKQKNVKRQSNNYQNYPNPNVFADEGSIRSGYFTRKEYYAIWHSKIKERVKHVQMAFYIEELSRANYW